MMPRSMFHLLFASLIMFSTALIAEPSTNRDYFAELEELFSKAQTPSEADVFGWYSGRCYSYDAHVTPLPSVLVGVKTQENGDHGPLFPPQYTFKLFPLQLPRAPEDYFDNLNEMQRNDLKRVIDRDSGIVSKMEIKSGSLSSSSDELEYHVRKSGNYLFLKSIILTDLENLKSGDTVYNCYYFKKIL